MVQALVGLARRQRHDRLGEDVPGVDAGIDGVERDAAGLVVEDRPLGGEAAAQPRQRSEVEVPGAMARDGEERGLEDAVVLDREEQVGLEPPRLLQEVWSVGIDRREAVDPRPPGEGVDGRGILARGAVRSAAERAHHLEPGLQEPG